MQNTIFACNQDKSYKGVNPYFTAYLSREQKEIDAEEADLEYKQQGTHYCWKIKLFYVQKCQTEINRFKVFDGQ